MKADGKRYIAYGSKLDWVYIDNISDVHRGSAGCAVSEFLRDVQEVADTPNCFWLSTGDLADYVAVDDKRFDADQISKDLKVADLKRLGSVMQGQLAKDFDCIKHKCLGIGKGNHELKWENAKQDGMLHQTLCDLLNVSNLGYSSLFDVVFVKLPGTKVPYIMPEPPKETYPNASFRIFTHHGSGAAQTEGGKLNRLIRFMNAFEADVYFIGHIHDRIVKDRPVLSSNGPCKKLCQRNRMGLVSGAYLKTYNDDDGGTEPSYGEVKGYAPVPLGSVRVKIQPYHRRLKAEI